MSVMVSGPEGLNEDQLTEARRLCDEVKSMAPRSDRKNSKAYETHKEKQFQEDFLRFVFEDNWNSFRKPVVCTHWKAKTVEQFALAVGTLHTNPVPPAREDKRKWKMIKVPTPSKGIPSRPARKPEDATAYCQPVIEGDTVVFKIIDAHSRIYSPDDVAWYGMGLTNEVKAEVSMHHDDFEFRLVGNYNTYAARASFQHYLWKQNVSEREASIVAVPDLKKMSLCLPVFSNMYYVARTVRRLAKLRRREKRLNSRGAKSVLSLDAPKIELRASGSTSNSKS
ncbi:hypothetical protein E8E14_013793 [Neopestalotiopsis sp. 37M]|nr:hypothetical protein E8E14_013793 [Neopestalotiopsis sp. 37M]